MALARMALAVALLACAWRHAHGGGEGTWVQVHPQSAQADGCPNGGCPSIRYGHAIASLDGCGMVSTLGYYYDREASHATWKSDTWSLDMCDPTHAWQLLHGGVEHADALLAYNAGAKPASPAGRFGHTAVEHDKLVYVYGGHDGGYSRHGEQNYVPGYDFDELWAFSPQRRTWTLQQPPAQTPTPGQRYLHCAASVAGRMILYGGMSAGQGDMWAYDFAQRIWERLSDEVPHSRGGPGRRVAATLTAVEMPGGATGVLLLGGQRIDGGGSSVLDPAPYFFDLADLRWRQLESAAAGGDGGVPAGRK